MSLQDEIDAKSSRIHRDAYQMSIGELISLYKDQEIDVHPEFQRVFRWDAYQKTRLIESILLNIPIPQIFVSQREDGVWDVIDGLQRLSTIFEFVGIYREIDGEPSKPFVLQKTDYLPSLEGVMWNNEEEPAKSFTTAQKINFKRQRMDVVIVKKESDENSKYELFRRLNTGGTNLTAQEVRNCVMIMINSEFYNFVSSLVRNQDFIDCIPISDRKSDEQYRMELLLKLLIADTMDLSCVKLYDDLTTLLDCETEKLCKAKSLDKDGIRKRFVKTFELLNRLKGDDCFKGRERGKAKGPFLSSAYQAIATGVFHHMENLLALTNEEVDDFINEKIDDFYTSAEFEKIRARGIRSLERFEVMSEYGMKYFKYER